MKYIIKLDEMVKDLGFNFNEAENTLIYEDDEEKVVLDINEIPNLYFEPNEKYLFTEGENQEEALENKDDIRNFFIDIIIKFKEKNKYTTLLKIVNNEIDYIGPYSKEDWNNEYEAHMLSLNDNQESWINPDEDDVIEYFNKYGEPVTVYRLTYNKALKLIETIEKTIVLSLKN